MIILAKFMGSVITCLILSFFVLKTSGENACAARAIRGQSVVCVCNETFCDDVIREEPAPGKYVSYTSSRAGSRFRKTVGDLHLENKINDCCTVTLKLNPDLKFQTIEGFGGAVTDATGINWKNMSNALQKHLIESYFGDRGIQYSMLRVPIGGCDFSTHPYAYNDLPENDTQLTNFTLAYEDYQYKIPMIKTIMAESSTPIHIVATTWSPPPWMKTNDKYLGFSRLKDEYFQTYADYHLKFIDKYNAEGVPVWAITTTNEPINGVIPLARFNSLGWTASQMGEWIVNNLGPTIRNSTYKDLKIIGLDDQRYAIPYWFIVMVREHPKALDYIDGVGVHYYGDFVTPPSFLSLITDLYPDKFLLATEASEGSKPWAEKVVIGSWERAANYIYDILTDLNHNAIGWLDWNLCLNEHGGPNWANNFVDSPVIVYPKKGEFIKQPMFYAMGHFSKFIPRGSRRIEVEETKPHIAQSVPHAAFLTPNNTIVVVIYNKQKAVRKISVKLDKRMAVIELEAYSVTTMEFNVDAKEENTFKIN